MIGTQADGEHRLVQRGGATEGALDYRPARSISQQPNHVATEKGDTVLRSTNRHDGAGARNPQRTSFNNVTASACRSWTGFVKIAVLPDHLGTVMKGETWQAARLRTE
jgi:hypothetical protein